MKVVVIPKMNVKLVLDVQAVQPILDSVQIYIVAHKEELIMEDGVFVQVVILVALMMGTVTMIMNANMGYHVVLTTVLLLLDFPHIMIVVISQLLEMNIFAHLDFFAEKMKEIVIQTLNVKATTFVDQIIVHFHLGLTLKLIAVAVFKS